MAEPDRYPPRDHAGLRDRCRRDGGSLHLDPTTGLLLACVSCPDQRVLWREVAEIVDGSAGAPPHSERERMVRYMCTVYPAARESTWRALTTEELGKVMGRLEVTYALEPAAWMPLRRVQAGTLAPGAARTSHRTILTAAGLDGIAFEPESAARRAGAGAFRGGRLAEVLTFENARSGRGSSLMYAARGSGLWYGVGTVATFGNAAQALRAVAARPAEAVAALCAAKREGLRREGVEPATYLQHCADGSGFLLADGSDVQPTLEEDEGMYGLLARDFAGRFDTLQFTEQAVACGGGRRRHVLVLLALRDFEDVALERVDPFEDDRITLRDDGGAEQ